MLYLFVVQLLLQLISSGGVYDV